MHCYRLSSTLERWKKTTKKKNKIIHSQGHLINHLKIFQRIKEIPQHFGFDLDRLAHAGIIFAPVGRTLRNGKKTSACLKKILRSYTLSWDLTDLTFRKTKPDFEIRLSATFFEPSLTAVAVVVIRKKKIEFAYLLKINVNT